MDGLNKLQLKSQLYGLIADAVNALVVIPTVNSDGLGTNDIIKTLKDIIETLESAEQECVEKMKNVERTFPICGWPQYSVPWSLVTQHEDQLVRNHGQTMELLWRRGGLSWLEMCYVLKDLNIHEKPPRIPIMVTSEYQKMVLTIIKDYERDINNKQNK
jgi:hypothetical protein